MLNTIFRRKPSSQLNALHRNSEAGFSLTEVMVAVFIIGLLSVVALGPVLNALSKGNKTAVKRDIATYETALTQYLLDMGEYPSTQDGLAALFELPSGSDKSAQYPENGYLQKRGILKDPWGNEYQYENLGSRKKPRIYSLGADGRPGGEGDDADISNLDD